MTGAGGGHDGPESHCVRSVLTIFWARRLHDEFAGGKQTIR